MIQRLISRNYEFIIYILIFTYHIDFWGLLSLYYWRNIASGFTLLPFKNYNTNNCFNSRFMSHLCKISTQKDYFASMTVTKFPLSYERNQLHPNIVHILLHISDTFVNLHQTNKGLTLNMYEFSQPKKDTSSFQKLSLWPFSWNRQQIYLNAFAPPI